MDFLELARSRYSVRKFSSRPVEGEKVQAILEAGRLAPTAANYQPQRVYAIESQSVLKRMAECTRYMFDAPMALVVCYDSAVSWKRRYDGQEMGMVDASIVLTHMMLAAWEMGVGSTWVGHFKPELLREILALPEGHVPVAILPLGYPAEGCEPGPLHYSRLALEDTVKYL